MIYFQAVITKKAHYLYINVTSSFLTLSQTRLSFENTVGKGEIARNEQFLLSHSVFYPFRNFLPFSSNLKLSSANSFSLGASKICRLGKG